MECVSKEIDSISTKYDNILILGDFNSEPTEESILNLLKISVKCIFNDLITANRPKSFQNFSTFDIELSDFHKMTLTMKSHSKNKKPDP